MTIIELCHLKKEDDDKQPDENAVCHMKKEGDDEQPDENAIPVLAFSIEANF